MAAQQRIAMKAAKRRKVTDKMWKLFKEKPWEGWTPQMVVGRCRRDGIPMVCKETLYQEYYRGQELVRRGLSKEVLPPRCRGARRGGFRLAASRRPLRGRLRPSSRAGLAFGAHQAKPSAEARFAGLTGNCHTTNQSQESTCLTMLRNACCVGYWKAGNSSQKGSSPCP